MQIVLVIHLCLENLVVLAFTVYSMDIHLSNIIQYQYLVTLSDKSGWSDRKKYSDTWLNILKMLILVELHTLQTGVASFLYYLFFSLQFFFYSSLCVVFKGSCWRFCRALLSTLACMLRYCFIFDVIANIKYARQHYLCTICMQWKHPIEHDSRRMRTLVY